MHRKAVEKLSESIAILWEMSEAECRNVRMLLGAAASVQHPNCNKICRSRPPRLDWTYLETIINDYYTTKCFKADRKTVGIDRKVSESIGKRSEWIGKCRNRSETGWNRSETIPIMLRMKLHDWETAEWFAKCRSRSQIVRIGRKAVGIHRKVSVSIGKQSESIGIDRELSESIGTLLELIGNDRLFTHDHTSQMQLTTLAWVILCMLVVVIRVVCVHFDEACCGIVIWSSSQCPWREPCRASTCASPMSFIIFLLYIVSVVCWALNRLIIKVIG